MRHIKFAIIAGFLCSAIIAGLNPMTGRAQDNKAEIFLQAAIKTETVDGDLRSAIEQYKKIVALPGAGRATVAAALLRMGQCYEKLGNEELREARRAYEQVVREYGDQAATAAEARSKLAALAGAENAPSGSALSGKKSLGGVRLDREGVCRRSISIVHGLGLGRQCRRPRPRDRPEPGINGHGQSGRKRPGRGLRRVPMPSPDGNLSPSPGTSAA